jgi:hypothetical protein
MADQCHDASFAGAIPRPRVVGPRTDGSTSVSRESVAELRVAYEGPTVRVCRTTAAGPEADDLVDARTTTLYGIHRDDGVWITECAWCKRVRSVAGEWQTLTASARSTIRAERTHGICSECADRLLIQAAR